MRRWVDVIADGVFLLVLGCSATGAVVTVYHLIVNWRVSWRVW